MRGGLCRVLWWDVIYIVIAKKDWTTYELPYGSFIGAAGLAIALWVHVFKHGLGPQ